MKHAVIVKKIPAIRSFKDRYILESKIQNIYALFLTGSCSYYLNRHNGHFKSPNYPSNYGNNEHCTWLIEVPRGYYIYLNFGLLDLERCSYCGCDVVTIFDGNSRTSPMIKRACDQQTSGCGMYSSGRFLFVEFSSDGSVTRRGFYATFYLVSYNYGNGLSRLSHAQQHVLSQGLIQVRMF